MGAGWVTPSEFWQLTPNDIWWLYEAKTAHQKSTDNAMSDDEWQDLYDWVDELTEEAMNSGE